MLGGGKCFVMLLSGMCNVPRGVRYTHATLGGSGGHAPPGIFFKIRSSKVDSNGFWGCYYIHVYLKSKF